MDDAEKGLQLAGKAGLLSGENSRIGNGMAAVILATAIVFDLGTLIPFVGDFVAPIFFIGLSLYLWKAKCGFLNAGRLASQIVSFVCEMFPGLQELPTIVLSAALIIILVRLEEKTGISIMKPMSQGQNPLNGGGIRPPSAGPTNLVPLNRDGVRQPYRANLSDMRTPENERTEENPLAA